MSDSPSVPSGSTADRPFSSRRFRWFFAGWSITMAGSAMSPLALAFGVLAFTHSAGWLSAVLAASMLPRVAMLVLSGGIADRYRRDRVLQLTSLGAGISQACVAILLITAEPPVLLLVPAAANGAFQALSTPTLRGIVPQLVGRRGLQPANSVLASSRNIAQLLGPAAAGLLVTQVGPSWVVGVDALSFLLAAACFARMSLPDLPPRAAHATSMLVELRQGWGYFHARPWIWSVTSAFAVFNAVNAGVWTILGPVIATRTVGATGWGLVLSARGAGALLSTVLMVRLYVRRPMVPAMSMMALAGAPLVLLGLGAGTAWLAAAAFAAGVAAEFFTVAWSTVWHVRVPERMGSRVSSWDEFGSFASIPVGQLTIPALAAAIGDAPVCIAGGALTALAMLLPLTVPSLRQIELHDPSD